MKKLVNTILLLGSSLLLLSSCSDDLLFDFLLGPQPNFIVEDNSEPALSVFGVIRPDSVQGKGMSFVLVEKIMNAINQTPDSFQISDANVMVYTLENEIAVDSFLFSFDTASSFPALYRADSFSPIGGQTVKIVCEREGFPQVTAQTTIPQVPKLYGDIVVNKNSITFSIADDPLAELYDVFLLTNGTMLAFERMVKQEAGSTSVKLSFFGSLPTDASVLIYAYDTNLAQYVTSPNVFFKPNTYRPPYSSVDGGFGCFGSMNMLVKVVNED